MNISSARSRLSGSPYDPHAVLEMERAFDETWAAIEPQYDATQMVAARLRLAVAILTLAGAGHREVGSLKKLAAIAMQAAKKRPA